MTNGIELNYVDHQFLHYDLSFTCPHSEVSYAGFGTELVPGSNDPFYAFTKVFPSSGVSCTASVRVSLE